VSVVVAVEGAAVVDVIPDATSALPVQEGLVIDAFHSVGLVPLLQVLVQIGSLSNVVGVVTVSLRIYRRRLLLLQLPRQHLPPALCLPHLLH
jgi:hypothetical protein